jgi:hypothetical protein
MIARVAAVSDEILHPVSEEQVLSTVANCGSVLMILFLDGNGIP